MREEVSFFFPHEGESLFGVLHRAHRDSATGLVFCYPFAEERQESHRVMANLAARLAENGSHVLRFDPRGTGDSEGNFGDYDLRDWISDILRAVEILKMKTSAERVGLLGLRLGGTCAILAAKESTDISFLVLVSPILDLKEYLRSFLRGNLAFQMATYREIRTNRETLIARLLGGGKVNVEGYHLSGDFYSQALEARPLEDFPADRCPSLILDVVSEEGKVNPSVAALAEKIAVHPSSRHLTVIEEPFWLERRYYIPDSRALTENAMAWIDSTD